nr:reverse transcriptase domain-containing protein [Streptomyces triticisoli]
MGKGDSVRAAGVLSGRDVVEQRRAAAVVAEHLRGRAAVLGHQLKLHRWARSDPARRFADVFNLICDRATLLVAWERVSGNRGARTAGVDAVTRYHVEERLRVIPFLEELRSSLKDGTFQALPVKQAVIPKKNGKVRYLGIPTLRDRVAQMALKLVLEPIFEADFYPSSYGYRPGRRAQDAIAEIHHLTSRPSNYEWVIEGDIKACFDSVDHHVLMDLVAERIKDRKVLRLVGAFLRAGVVELHARGRSGADPPATAAGTCRASCRAPRSHRGRTDAGRSPSDKPPRSTTRSGRRGACRPATAHRAVCGPRHRRCPYTAQDAAVGPRRGPGTPAPATADGPPADTRTSSAFPNHHADAGTGPPPCAPSPRATRSSTTAARPSAQSAGPASPRPPRAVPLVLRTDSRT